MPPPLDTTNPCFILTISGSQFLDFGSMKSTTSHAVYVDPTYKMQYYGTILDLDNFPGHVFIYNNIFTNNVLKYSSCDIAQNEMQDASTFAGTDNYNVFGSKTHLQIRSLISINVHTHKIEILGNTFTSNSGTKGIIFIQPSARTIHPVVIAGNTFTKNVGYIDSNVIFVRAKGSTAQDVYSLVPNIDAR